jgi:hypothetical protein
MPTTTPTHTLRTTLRSPRHQQARVSHRRTSSRPAGRESGRRRRGEGERHLLGRYCDWMGRDREIVTLPGAGESLLVLDRDAATLGDRRLLAHLAPDEPPENAAVVSRCFLRQARQARCGCRRLRVSDLQTVPSYEEPGVTDPVFDASSEEVHDHLGRRYRLERLAGTMSIPELRWCRRPPEGESGQAQPVSVRGTVASLERYEPVLVLTRRALAHRGEFGEVSVATLRAEMTRVQESPIVLNRALRAAVLDVVERQGQSMSEIAMRCGRVKRDAAGNASGETSWLGRRLGLLPEGGQRVPTPWIHTDVLALIARDGLGLSPREVEAD